MNWYRFTGHGSLVREGYLTGTGLMDAFKINPTAPWCSAYVGYAEINVLKVTEA